MKKSHYTTITEGNISLIAFRIKQFIERMGAIGLQGHYPNTKWYNKNMLPPNAGYLDKEVEKTSKSYLLANDYKLEVVKYIDDKLLSKRISVPFIRINAAADYGFAIHIEQKIRFTGAHVYLIEPLRTSKHGFGFSLDVWQKADEETARRFYSREKQYSDDYWAFYEREQIDEMIREDEKEFLMD